MGDILPQLLSQLGTVSKSPLALAGYLSVVIAWVAIAFRLRRNRELLRNIEKLPKKDRIKAFQSEIGEVPIKGGFTPEQYLRFRNQRYYFLAGLAFILLLGFLFSLTAYRAEKLHQSAISKDWSNYRLISQAVFDPETPEQEEHDCRTWLCGQDGAWNNAMANGKRWSENTVDPSAIQYIFINETDRIGDWGKVIGVGPYNPLSVDVTIAAGEPDQEFESGAGLLFRFRPENYYLYIVSNSGNIVFSQFLSGTLSTIYEQPIQGFNRHKEYRLGIAGDKEQIFLFFNNNLVQVVSDSKNIQGSGGIVYLGKGRYGFDNFRIFHNIE
jgi:hypothetical protein